MSFFFSTQKRSAAQRRDASRPAVDTLHSLECRACPLNNANVGHPKMAPTGSDQPLVYILGEAPGEREDKGGEQFIGPAGRVLRDAIPSWYKDRLRFNNVIRTRPPGNRNPTWQEVECCRPSIVRDIEQTKPRAIFGFGNVPLAWVTGLDTITSWRGRRMPVRVGSHVCWFYPMLHPSYVLRQQRAQEQREKRGVDIYQTHEGLVFKKDLHRALDELSVVGEPVVETPDQFYVGIELLTKVNDVIDALGSLSEEPVLGIDIETNGLRPYRTGSKLLSVAIGTYARTVAFPIRHSQVNTHFTERDICTVEEMVGDFLLSHRGVKVAHNLSFELEWLSHFFGRKLLRGTSWGDTQAQAYVLDERRSVLSLDLLCLQYFGFNLKPISNLNRAALDQERLEDVLKYNALDTKYTHALYLEQQAELDRLGLTGFYEREQLRRIPTVVMTQQRGIVCDLTATRKNDAWLAIEIKKVLAAINNNAAVTAYKKQFGAFNPGSTTDVVKLFRDVLKCKEGWVNDKYKAGEEVLKEIKHPVAQLILDYRRYTKLKSTYTDPFLTKGGFVYPDGKLHTNLNTVFTETGRLSSDDPNTQNFPKRKDKWVRNQIVASPGHILVACDYGQIEPRVIAAWSGDEVLIKLLWENYDIHLHWAKRIAELHPSALKGRDLPALRQDTKSNFVLAGFYGSEAFSIARRMGLPRSLCEDLLGEFWGTFVGVKRWQHELMRQYKKQGYVECKTGRRRHAPLVGNRVINTPIQGTASDVVVDAMNRLSELADKENDAALQPIMNIHDDLTFDLPEDLVDDYMQVIINEMLSVSYDFMKVVPISVEVECGYDWAHMEGVGTFTTEDWLNE